MCFAPQRRALFRHLNFQKWSDAEVFCTFSLWNRLRATTACNFSSLISPDVSAPAALASLLFNPPEPQNHEKTQCFATFLPFRAPASSFFWSFLFWLFSLLTAFHLSILSEVWLPNFLRLLLTTTYYYLLWLSAPYNSVLLLATTYCYLLLLTTTSYYLLLLTTTYY